MQEPVFLAHLLGVAVYLGATVFLALLLPAVGRRARDASERRQRYAAVFAVYGPVVLAALLAVVMTGAWSLTPYKQAMGPEYFAELGSALAGKLVLAFVIVIFGVYLAMGIGLRLVRADQGALPVTDPELDRQLRRACTVAWLLVALVVYTIWLALGMQPVRQPW